MGIKVSPYEIIECIRCGKSEFGANCEGWNADFDKGALVGYICPSCQTDEDFTEAEINAVFTDYSTVRSVGSLNELLDMLRPQFEKAMRTIADGEVEKGNELFKEYLEQFKDIANAMQRNNPNFYLEDINDAYEFLADLGELPEL